MGKKKKEKKEKKSEKILKSEKKLKKEKKNSEKKKGSASGKTNGKVRQDSGRKEPVSGRVLEPASGERTNGRVSEPAPGERTNGRVSEPASGERTSGRIPEPAPGERTSGRVSEPASGERTSGRIPEPAPGEPVSGSVPESTAGQTAGKRTAESIEKNPSASALDPSVPALDLAAVFHTLSDENRLRILNLLAEREMCAFEILHSLAVAQSTISHHMKVLCETGLVICEKRGKRSCYHINGERMEQVAAAVRKWSQT